MPPSDPDTARWFAEQVLPHEPLLRAWLRARYPQERDIDDLIQESYLRLLQARAQGEFRSAKAFLFATARNLAIDRLRRMQRAGGPALEFPADAGLPEDAASIPEVVARNQEMELLTAAIQALPDRCRRVFTLCKVYGLPQKEIAQRLGISVCTVSAQLTKAVHRCHEHLAQVRREREDRR